VATVSSVHVVSGVYVVAGVLVVTRMLTAVRLVRVVRRVRRSVIRVAQFTNALLGDLGRIIPIRLVP
jgi:hypothetical protein